MSFFGYDTALPRDRGHPSTAPGFGQAQDPFAGLSRGNLAEDEDDGYVFLFLLQLKFAKVEIKNRF